MRLGLGIVAVLALCATATAQPSAPPPPAAEPERALIVGTKVSPPFVVKNPDGSMGGLAIELWRLVATDMGKRMVVRPFEQIQGLLDAVERRELDIAVGAITVTDLRARRVDFSVPYFRTGLAIAAREELAMGPAAVARQLLGLPLLFVLLLLGATAAGVLAMARRRWLAGGAALAAALLLAGGLAAWAGATAAVEIAAARIRGPEDLPHVRVAAVPGSTSATYLADRDITFEPIASPQDGLRKVQGGAVDAVVHDAPILRALLRDQPMSGVVVVPGVFERQDYAFALPRQSALREELDRHLDERLAGDTWRQLQETHLGSAGVR